KTQTSEDLLHARSCKTASAGAPIGRIERPVLYQIPKILTRRGFPNQRGSDSTWRTEEVRHVGSYSPAWGFRRCPAPRACEEDERRPEHGDAVDDARHRLVLAAHAAGEKLADRREVEAFIGVQNRDRQAGELGQGLEHVGGCEV